MQVWNLNNPKRNEFSLLHDTYGSRQEDIKAKSDLTARGQSHFHSHIWRSCWLSAETSIGLSARTPSCGLFMWFLSLDLYGLLHRMVAGVQEQTSQEKQVKAMLFFMTQPCKLHSITSIIVTSPPGTREEMKIMFLGVKDVKSCYQMLKSEIS